MKLPSLLRRLLLVGVMVVPLYVLSYAPALAFQDRFSSPSVEEMMLRFYVPVRWVIEETPIGGPLDRYETWWFEIESKYDRWREKKASEAWVRKP